MENNQKEGKIRNRKFYLPSVFMFYTLKKEYLTPVLFVILLAIGGLLISIEGQGITYLILSFLLFFISDACFSVYLVAYIRELKGESFTVKACILKVGKRIHRIFFLSLAYYFIFSLVLSIAVFNPLIIIPLLSIPFIAGYILFMLNICYVLDLNYAVFESFAESKDTVIGYKSGIIRIAFMFMFPVAVCSLFVLIVASLSNNKLIFPVVLYFVYIIVRFMLLRFRALLYYDIEYRHNQEIDEEEF